MSELVMIESSSAADTGTETPEEYLAWAAPLVAERGTDAASVACDESGALLTPPGFADVCLDVAPTGRVVACRRVTGGAFSALDNVDYVTEHWSLAIFTEPGRFGRLENSSTHWLYSGEWRDGDHPRASPTTPVWDAGMARFAPDGSSYLFAEFRAQRDVYVWREDVATGERVGIAALPQAVLLGDISFIGDGTWAVVGAGASMYLLNAVTGQFAQLPQRFQAACWDSAGGPSSLLVAQGDGKTSVLSTYSLATGAERPVCELPARVLGLDVSDQGEIAAVVSAADTGSTPNVAVVDAVAGSYELLLPPRFECGATRWTQRPRWLFRPEPPGEPTSLSDGWTAALRQVNLTRTVEDDLKFYQEWRERIDRRVGAVSADPLRVRLLGQLMALCFEAYQLHRGFAEVALQEVVPGLREIARRPLPDDLRAIYSRCADDIEGMMRP